MPKSIFQDDLFATPFSPLSRQRAENSEPGKIVTAPAGLKVLIADDSPVVAKVLSSLLIRAGYEVVMAADGIEAAQAVYRELPDVILLDIFMPRMNGYQVCRLIKHDPAVSHIPVIINTASEGRSPEFWSRHTGADDFMLKGVSPEELLGAITRLTDGRPATSTASFARREAPDPEEILCKVCALGDQELYDTTVKSIELETMLANLTEGILTVDNQGRISSANHFLCHLLDTPEAELKGRDCGEALGEKVGGVARELVQQALGSQTEVSREAELETRGGRITSVEISAVQVNDYLGEVIGAICVFQDITRLREIETLNRLKNDLTDMIVHDLRTPLTALLGGIETVEMLGDLTADQKELLNISIEGGQILLGMVNDMLDISKMEEGSMHIERKPVETAGLMRRALRQINTLAQAKGLDLHCEPKRDVPLLELDEEKLLRTLVNLLANAIKFTPAGGSITLSSRLVEGDSRGEAVIFTVEDTGEGIPEDAFGRIFEKFGQVESRMGGRRMSTGLGLTFCKMAVEAHGGRIWVESTLGQGSSFFIEIPVV